MTTIKNCLVILFIIAGISTIYAQKTDGSWEGEMVWNNKEYKVSLVLLSSDPEEEAKAWWYDKDVKGTMVLESDIGKEIIPILGTLDTDNSLLITEHKKENRSKCMWKAAFGLFRQKKELMLIGFLEQRADNFNKYCSGAKIRLRRKVVKA